MLRTRVQIILFSLVLVGIGGAVMDTTSTVNASANTATPTNVSQQVVDQPHFKANLRGIQQFSSQTNATGEAYFRILDEQDIAYAVDVRDVSRISNGIITYWHGGGPGVEVVSLPLAGGMGRGTFGVDDFSQNAPVEQSIADFVKNVIDGNIYLKIVTVQSPLGEVAGKLVPQVN
ncbi:MAG TPA: CHRD domain-containing protein [Nitrososphaeraceae archaeon]|nr:CHRD domain-containing protein [Nitrososphaeraceae archaeon]